MKRLFICISILFFGIALFAEDNSELPRYKGFAIGGDVFGQFPIGDYAQFANANIGLSLAGEYTFPLNLPKNMDLGIGIRAEYGHVFPKSDTSLKSDEEIRAFANLWLRIPFKLFNQYFAFQPEVGGGISNFFTKYQIKETEKSGTYLSPFISIAPSLRWIPSSLQKLEVEFAPIFTIVPEKDKTTNMLGLRLGAIWHFEMKKEAVVDETAAEEKCKAKEAKKAEKARLAEEEKKRREEEKEKARLAEEERKHAEEVEKARLAEEEAEKARLAAEEAEKARLAAEEEEKARFAAEEEAKRLAAEEAEKKRLAEEEAARQAEEEAKLSEEAEKERLAEEKRLADEAEKQRLEKERLAAEERKRAEERIAAEEAEKARLAEEEAKRVEEAEKAEKARIAAEEEEKARLAAEEEAKRLAAEEAEKERLAAEEEREPVEEDETEEYTPTSVRLGLKNILFFSKNGAVFSGLSRKQIARNERTIDEAVALIKKYPDCHVLIEGYANNISGTEKENRTACMPLSLWRAEYIKKELIKRGIKAEQIETVGRGGTNPLAGRKDRNNWWKNRRVEFVITY